MATNINTIRVTLEANAKGLRQQVDSSKKKLQQFKKTTGGVSSGQKKFQENLRNTAGAIAAVQGPLGPVAGRISSIGAIIGRVNPLTLAFFAGFTAVGVVLGKFVSAGSKAESQALKLEAIIKATGGSAQQTAVDIENLAQSIGINTLASVQGARDAAGVLLTFKSISGDTFGEVLKLSQDLAAVGFGSINTAALQLGKALEEPEIGLSALRRVGVSFTEQQKEQIKVLSLTGRQQEAQALIIKALKEQVGGAGAGAAGGLAGAFDTLGENLTLFFEKAELGKKIVSGLTRIINSLSNVLAKFIPEPLELSDNLRVLNQNFKETDDQIKKNIQRINELVLKEEGLRKQKEKAKVKKQIKELEETTAKLQAENLARKQKIDFINAEKEAINKASDIADKSIEKIVRATERETELAEARGAQAKFLQLRNKLEDALRSKLGESEDATKAINVELQRNKEKLLETALAEHERQLAIENTRALEEKALKTTTKRTDTLSILGAKNAKQEAILNEIFKERDRLLALFKDEPNRLARVNEELIKQIPLITEQTGAFFEQTEKLKDLNQIADGIGTSFESAGKKITDAFIEGKTASLDFKAILRELLIDIQKTIIQTIILDRVKAGATQVAKSIFGGFFTPSSATGGNVQQANQPRLVGERGPELFVPRTAGSIVPSSLTPGAMSGGGQGVVINQNLNFALGVTSTVRTEIANLLPAIQQSTISAVADAKLRGGKFAKAFGG
jgi:hypothetical protein